MNLSKFSSLLKALSLIPVLVAVLTFADGVLPLRTIDTVITGKNETFRIKTGSTTYSIYFDGLNDQFTEDVYLSFSEGDSVQVKATFFTREIEQIKHLNEPSFMDNGTAEVFFRYLFVIVFLLAGLSWFKQGDLTKRQAIFVGVIVLLSLTSGIRMIVLNYF